MKPWLWCLLICGGGGAAACRLPSAFPAARGWPHFPPWRARPAPEEDGDGRCRGGGGVGSPGPPWRNAPACSSSALTPSKRCRRWTWCAWPRSATPSCGCCCPAWCAWPSAPPPTRARAGRRTRSSSCGSCQAWRPSTPSWPCCPWTSTPWSRTPAKSSSCGKAEKGVFCGESRCGAFRAVLFVAAVGVPRWPRRSRSGPLVVSWENPEFWRSNGQGAGFRCPSRVSFPPRWLGESWPVCEGRGGRRLGGLREAKRRTRRVHFLGCCCPC